MSENLLEKLKKYGASDFYPLHMPGHKRRISHFGDPFAIDITEIDGFDDLHHAQGILLEAQRRAARLYGAEETYYLVNGSTCGILAAVAASVRRGGHILMARNSHKSCYHAAFLNDLHVTYLYPPVCAAGGADEGNSSANGAGETGEENLSTGNAGEGKSSAGGAGENDSAVAVESGDSRDASDKNAVSGLCGSIRPEDVREALRQHPDVQAVLVTSPTYDGVVSDIAAIAEAAHAAGAILIVDEAHGAHFGMHPYFPERALACGADIVINSLHKTLPSLTQTALLHVQGKRADREKLRKYLDIYQTSSPSYVLMAGMDACIRLLEEQGGELFSAFVTRLERMRGELRRKLRVLQLVGGFGLSAAHENGQSQNPADSSRAGTGGTRQNPADSDHTKTIYDFDRSKVLISTAAVSGEMISASRFGRFGLSGSCAVDCGAGGIAMTGPELAEILRRQYHLEPEMAAANYVTAIMTVADTQEGFDRLTEALLEIDAALAGERETALPCAGERAEGGTKSTGKIENATGARWTEYPVNEEVLSVRQAQESPTECVLLSESAGRISAEYVYLYPPGIPLLVPGERISEELLGRLERERNSGSVLRGMADDEGNVIRTVREADCGTKCHVTDQ